MSKPCVCLTSSLYLNQVDTAAGVLACCVEGVSISVAILGGELPEVLDVRSILLTLHFEVYVYYRDVRGGAAQNANAIFVLYTIPRGLIRLYLKRPASLIS